jgi:hypothetical protein
LDFPLASVPGAPTISCSLGLQQTGLSQEIPQKCKELAIGIESPFYPNADFSCSWGNEDVMGTFAGLAPVVSDSCSPLLASVQCHNDIEVAVEGGAVRAGISGLRSASQVAGGWAK